MTTSTELAALRDDAIKLTVGMSEREYNLANWIKHLERARLWEQDAATDEQAAQWLADDLEEAKRYRDRYLREVAAEKGKAA
jgi:hypothetical protein